MGKITVGRSMTRALEQAVEMADRADAITMRYFHSADLVAQTKPDNTPVTQGDREVEAAVAALAAEYGDGVYGEEGARVSDKLAQWIVDPIDGTKNFLRGMPIWATLLARVDEQGTQVAMVSAPALGRRWWAERGAGAFVREIDGTVRQLKVSKVAKLGDAYLGYGSETGWRQYQNGNERVLDLLASAWRSRGIGDFWMHVLVAEGAIDAAFEPKVALWDYAAPKLIVEEAGGDVWLDTPRPGDNGVRSIVSSNGLVGEAVRRGLGLDD